MKKMLADKKLNKDFAIKKHHLEWVIIFFIFAFSLFNKSTLLFSLFIMIIYLFKQEIGALKIINLIILRTIINPGISISISEYQSFKWVMLFICSFILINGYFKLNLSQKSKLKPILRAFFIFFVYSIFSSFTFSNLPMIAIAKLLSYGIVFIGIIIGVCLTKDEFDWLRWMRTMLGMILLFSIPFVWYPLGYLRNGHAFQGLTNQPNMFGIISALFVSLELSIAQKEKGMKLSSIVMTAAVIYMSILSESRTGVITISALLFVYLFFSNVSYTKKLIYSLFIFSFIFILFVIFKNEIYEALLIFLYKGQEVLIESRLPQVSGLLDNFSSNFLFGTGFAVPVSKYRTYTFNYEFIVEPGNLILAMLSYGGIIGFILFLNYMIKIAISNNKNFLKNIFLLISSILLSMGEMVFFSSNSIGVWMYMFLAIYISY